MLARFLALEAPLPPSSRSIQSCTLSENPHKGSPTYRSTSAGSRDSQSNAVHDGAKGLLKASKVSDCASLLRPPGPTRQRSIRVISLPTAASDVGWPLE